ncbi:Scarecrow-like protein 9 [Hordeum vulgare]|nr:Scarecrow-like protein 9 [Hordeum vulgare]
METRLEEMEQQVFKCQGMVERGLNANHTMITKFTSNHKMDAIDIGKHLSRLYDRVDQLQGQIYDLQNQNCEYEYKFNSIRTSHYFASQAILDVSQGQPRVHIIDFGIGFDLQCPLIFQRFSQQEEGVPKLRITGIDVPQQGFHPCEMIEETGKRLADYAHMFKVPFQYHGIATSRWDTIKIQDLKLTKLNNAISQTG